MSCCVQVLFTKLELQSIKLNWEFNPLIPKYLDLNSPNLCQTKHMKSVGRIDSLTNYNPNKRSPANFSIVYHTQLAINWKEKFVHDLLLRLFLPVFPMTKEQKTGPCNRVPAKGNQHSEEVTSLARVLYLKLVWVEVGFLYILYLVNGLNPGVSVVCLAWSSRWG